MSEKTLYLGWQDRAGTRAWFPVGRLDVDFAIPRFRFRHVQGAERARDTGGFAFVPGFADLCGDYRSPELFPVFRNRVMSPRRPDFPQYVSGLGLDPSADFTEILAVDGGERVTDYYEVFPKLSRNGDGAYLYRFFLHGSHHANARGREKVETLRPGDSLQVAVEDETPAERSAVQIRTMPDSCLIGWASRYFAHDFLKARTKSDGAYEAQVVQVNPPPHPSEQQVLVEVTSRWERHEPMSGEEFRPLVE